MPNVHAQLRSDRSPAEVLRVLTDFGPDRTKRWSSNPDTYAVHDQGEGWADVTEGVPSAWERLRYDWDAAAGTVTAVTTDSNIWADGSRWAYRLTPDGTGTGVDIRLSREGRSLKGRLIGVLVGLMGRRFITGSLDKALQAG